jgi:hypothetical protein
MRRAISMSAEDYEKRQWKIREYAASVYRESLCNLKTKLQTMPEPQAAGKTCGCDAHAS